MYKVDWFARLICMNLRLNVCVLFSVFIQVWQGVILNGVHDIHKQRRLPRKQKYAAKKNEFDCKIARLIESQRVIFINRFTGTCRYTLM